MHGAKQQMSVCCVFLSPAPCYVWNLRRCWGRIWRRRWSLDRPRREEQCPGSEARAPAIPVLSDSRPPWGQMPPDSARVGGVASPISLRRSQSCPQGSKATQVRARRPKCHFLSCEWPLHAPSLRVILDVCPLPSVPSSSTTPGQVCLLNFFQIRHPLFSIPTAVTQVCITISQFT